MKVGLLQFNPVFGEVHRNVDYVADLLVQGLRNNPADLIVLPELFTTGYQFISKQEAESLAEEIPSGSTSGRLAELCRDLNLYIVAGLAEKVGDKLYNSAALFGPDGHIGTYRKTHLFYEEKRWFEPGDTGFLVFDIGVARLGLMVCFDWIFPESTRTLALMGADIICHPSNLVLPYCPEAIPIHCLENRVFAITCNRIGHEERGGKERLTFIGKSQIVTPKGEVLTRASDDWEQLVTASIDPREARGKRINEYNDLFEDRRPEFYL